MLFKVAGKDYTSKIVEGTYEVNEEDVYTQWTDANYVRHRQVMKTRLSGSFEMYFPTEDAWIEFLNDINSAKTIAGYYNFGLMCNNTHQFNELVGVFLEFNPKRKQKVLGKAYFPSVIIKVEER